ncbi:MAG: DUF3794 domain-containing protein [Acutalibacteraceae bacterium]|nr:DUF3794 domain-containing protein [Acutalibacteraceae bacterium]
MDYTLLKKSVSIKEIVFDGCTEQPVDLDLTLPDYCPDILRILKCRVTPKILTKNISGDRLDVEGTAEIKILYIDSIKKSVRCSDHNMPFSSSFNMKQSPQNAIVTAKVKTEYINCRALSPRRLDIHGAFSVCAKVICKSEKDFPIGIDDKNVQAKGNNVKLSTLEGMGQQQFILSDNITLGSNASDIESVLKSDATVIVGDCKAISNKVMVKGDVNIRVLYLSDINTGETKIFDYTMPFSEILDADGVDESCLCVTNIELVNHTVNVKSDYSDANKVVNFEIKLLATAMGYKTEEIVPVDDAYSTEYDLNLVYSQSQLNNIEKSYNESCITKATVEAGSDSIASVIDLWCEQCSTLVVVEDGNVLVKGKLNMCILARNSEDMPFYSERVIEFTYPITQASDNTAVEVNGTVQSISYRINGSNSLDFRIETRLDITILTNCSVRYVTSVDADTEHPRVKDNNTALTLYYASRGESVWNIAKEYAVCCSLIMEENELKEDEISASVMLFIPNV